MPRGSGAQYAHQQVREGHCAGHRRRAVTHIAMSGHRAHLALLLFLVLCIVPAKGQSFRFAQLTDLHLQSDDDAPTRSLQRSIQAINALDSIDFVLVTGDVSCLGDRPTLLRAKEMLDQLRFPYHIIMGNHETKWSASGCTAWQEIFGYERFQFTYQGVHFLGFNTGPLMRMAYGHVVAQDLSWLEQQMTAWPKDEPVIIVTHYPLLDGDVDNWYRATDLLRRHNVRLCIGGHYHQTRVMTYDGLPGILMRSTLSDADKHTGFGLYKVTPDSIHVWKIDLDTDCDVALGIGPQPGPEPELIATFPLKGPVRYVEGEVLDPEDYSLNYPDSTENATYPQTRRQWLVHTPASIYSTPAVEGQRLFVGDDAGCLTAYHLRNGHRLWSQTTGARIVGSPAASRGTVVVGSADGTIRAFSTRTGKLRWIHRAQGPVLGAVAIAGDTVFIGASDHCMRALDLRTGRLFWQYTQVEGYIETRPLVTAQHVVFGAWDGSLYCLRRTDGTLAWQWQVPHPNIFYSPAAVWPVHAQGRVLIADPQRALTALDLSSGHTIWRTYQSKVRESIGLSTDARRLYAKTMADSVVCYDAGSHTPRQLWATDVGFGYEHAPCMLTERDGVVYGATCSGRLFALEAHSGRLLWRHRVGSSLVNTPLPLSRRRLLFTTSDGIIGLLKTKAKK